MNTGMANAARPEVDGTAKAVATRAAPLRCINCRTSRAPEMMKTAALVASPEAVMPAAMTNEPSNSQTVSSPRESKSVFSGNTPITTRTTAAPNAT